MQQFPSAPRPDQSRNGGRHSLPPRIPAPRAPGNQPPQNRIPSPRPPQPGPSRIVPTTATAAGQQTAVQTQPNAAIGLTINKVIAGAGAAATSAVLGSFFGAEGTVAGAALGSIASTMATSLYEHSLNRTQDSVAALRSRRRASATAAEVIMQMPRIPPVGTAQGDPPQDGRPSWLVTMVEDLRCGG